MAAIGKKTCPVTAPNTVFHPDHFTTQHRTLAFLIRRILPPQCSIDAQGEDRLAGPCEIFRPKVSERCSLKHAADHGGMLIEITQRLGQWTSNASQLYFTMSPESSIPFQSQLPKGFPSNLIPMMLGWKLLDWLAWIICIESMPNYHRYLPYNSIFSIASGPILHGWFLLGLYCPALFTPMGETCVVLSIIFFNTVAVANPAVAPRSLTIKALLYQLATRNTTERQSMFRSNTTYWELVKDSSILCKWVLWWCGGWVQVR